MEIDTGDPAAKGDELVVGFKAQRDRKDDLAPTEKKMKPSEVVEFDQLLDELADYLKLARHPDSLITLKSAQLLLERVFNGKNSSRHSDGHKLHCAGDSESIRIQKSKFSLDDITLPRSLYGNLESSGNKYEASKETNESKVRPSELAFEHAAKALKLLFLDDQKQLQNQVNETISSIQSITANPKTDSRLLSTGR